LIENIFLLLNKKDTFKQIHGIVNFWRVTIVHAWRPKLKLFWLKSVILTKFNFNYSLHPESFLIIIMQLTFIFSLVCLSFKMIFPTRVGPCKKHMLASQDYYLTKEKDKGCKTLSGTIFLNRIESRDYRTTILSLGTTGLPCWVSDYHTTPTVLFKPYYLAPLITSSSVSFSNLVMLSIRSLSNLTWDITAFIFF
jgi:hypothetical protein